MSKVKKLEAKVTRALNSLERSIMNDLYEGAFIRRKREGKKAVRLVVDKENRHVEVVSADKTASDEAYDLLESGKFNLDATSLRPITDEDLMQRLQEERTTYVGLLGGKK